MIGREIFCTSSPEGWLDDCWYGWKVSMFGLIIVIGAVFCYVILLSYILLHFGAYIASSIGLLCFWIVCFFAYIACGWVWDSGQFRVFDQGNCISSYRCGCAILSLVQHWKALGVILYSCYYFYASLVFM